MSDTRIVLVKPGDVLMLGNVTLPEGDGWDVFADALRTLKETLGLAHDILVFEDDIDLAVKPGGWYGQGGTLPCAREPVRNDTDQPIPVSTEDQIRHGSDYIRDRYGSSKDGN